MRPLLFAAALAAAALTLAAVRGAAVGVGVPDLAPAEVYDVAIRMAFEGSGQDVEVAAYLPQTGPRHRVTGAESVAGPLAFEPLRDSTGLQGVWQGEAVAGPQAVAYTFRVEGTPVVFELDPGLTIPADPGPALRPYLGATDVVQTDHPEIAALAGRALPATRLAEPVVRAAFDVAAGLTPEPFKGRTDAVTAARLGRASCNGKSRLLLALARRAGVPGRLVGGLILTEGTKRVSHQWVELALGGVWVPFDPLNGHFASLPAHYLRLYTGDEYLFAHTPNIGFDYRFEIARVGRAVAEPTHALDAARLWAGLGGAGIPPGALRLLLLLPVAATVVAFARNVVGLETHGVFLPALLAVAALDVGLAPTLVAYAAVTALVGALHGPLGRAGLLYTPRMTLMLVGTVVGLAGLSVAASWAGWRGAPAAAVLPLVIVAVSAERFARHLSEEGARKAASVMGMTLVVVAACYGAVAPPVVEAGLLAFPELLLVVVAANLALGRWMGLRITEYRRFRWLVDRSVGRDAAGVYHGEALGINRRNADVIHRANDRRHFALADDKCATKGLLEPHGIPVPETFAVITEVGEIRDGWPFLAGLDEFVVKPARGRAGANILVLARDGDVWRTPGGTELSAEGVQRAIADIVSGHLAQGAWDAALVERRVWPHPFFRAIADGGLPDIRVIVHHGEVVQAMARIPTAASDGKANLHQGALGVGIDVITGRMGPGYDYERYVEAHPDTGVVFAGQTVPLWGEIVRIAVAVADLVPLKYLGVDVVLDASAGPLVMEVNARPGIEIQNVNRAGLRPHLAAPNSGDGEAAPAPPVLAPPTP